MTRKLKRRNSERAILQKIKKELKEAQDNIKEIYMLIDERDRYLFGKKN